MPTGNVNLTDELDTFVLAKIESGRYAALRTLEREEQLYEAKLAALRVAIDAGDGSGVARGNPFDRVRQTLIAFQEAALSEIIDPGMRKQAWIVAVGRIFHE